MPILSFSVSESLRKFIKSMLKKKDYKNQSDLIRTALTRLMNESDGATVAIEEGAVEEAVVQDLNAAGPPTAGDVVLVYESDDEDIKKKVHKIERTFSTCIKTS